MSSYGRKTPYVALLAPKAKTRKWKPLNYPKCAHCGCLGHWVFIQRTKKWTLCEISSAVPHKCAQVFCANDFEDVSK